MADFQAVEFDGGPSSATNEPGAGSSVLDGAETPPAEIPAGGDETSSIEEQLASTTTEAAVEDDGSTAGTLEEAAAFFAKQVDDKTLAPAEPAATTTPADEEDFFSVMGQDSEIGADTAKALKDKYGGSMSAMMRGLVSAQKKLGSRDEDAAFAQEFRQNPQATLQKIGYTPQPGQEQPGQGQESNQRAQYDAYLKQTWGAPEYDPNWENQVEAVYDADGKAVSLKVKDGVQDTAIPQKLQAWHEFKQKKNDEFIKDPSTIWNAIAPGIQHMVNTGISQAQNQNQAVATEQAQGNQFIETNSHWLYNTVAGVNGQQVAGPRTKDNLSAAGNVFYEGIAEAQQFGVPTTEGQIKWAAGRMQQATQTQQQPQAAAAPAQVAPTGQTVAPGMDNGLYYNADAGLSLDETLRRNLAAAGIQA